jgi:hypothetical protein
MQGNLPCNYMAAVKNRRCPCHVIESPSDKSIVYTSVKFQVIVNSLSRTGNKVPYCLLSLFCCMILLKLLCHIFHAFITSITVQYFLILGPTCAYALFSAKYKYNLYIYLYIQLTCLFIIVSYMAQYGVTFLTLLLRTYSE